LSRNIRIDLDFIGRGFKGWQKQSKGPTVQQELEKALSIILRESVKVTGASRTDAGVNARGMTANFRTSSRMDLGRLCKGLNGILPDAIEVTDAVEVDNDWHARKSAVYREYEYLIWNKPYADVFRKDWVCHMPKPLDVGAMRKAAEWVVGRHDFTAFCVATSASKGCVRTVEFAEISEPEPGMIRFVIRADGFVHKMVRSIVGTLLDIGQGKKDVSALKEALDTGNRQLAGKTAPANGLTLIDIGYETKNGS